MVAGLFIGLMLLEAALPLRERKAPVLKRVLTNAAMSALVFMVGSFVVRPVALTCINFNEWRHSGVLYFFPLPPFLQIALGFLLMDMTFYWWHRANHVWPLLWRFHNIHHLDPDLDVTTSFRFHFIEVLYSTAFRAIQVSALGINTAAYVIYEIIFQIATMFHHSNWRLPIQFERGLNIIFVTPRMHGIHHSFVKEETNSNYSVIFKSWDWLFGTLRLNVAQTQITIGVPGYSAAEDNRLIQLMLAPFKKQKDYWPADALRRPRPEASAPGAPDALRRPPAAASPNHLAE